MAERHFVNERSRHLDRLIFLLVVTALAGIWAISIAYAIAERGGIVERAQRQLHLTAETLADFNELAQQATGTSLSASNQRRTAAVWRALLQYPAASIWVESNGVVTAGQPPTGDLSSYIVVTENRPGFSVHAAVPRSAALAGWRQALWRRGAILVAISIAFLVLTKFLTDALRQRAAAEERIAQLARYRAELEETVAQRTTEINNANSLLQIELRERRAAEAALRAHDAFLKAVTRGAAELLGSRSFEEAVPAVLELIGQTVAVSRVQIHEIVTDRDGHLHTRLTQEWCAPGLSSLIAEPALKDFDLTANVPNAITPALTGTAASYDVDEVAEPFRAQFGAAGIRSCLMVPLHIDARLWGCLLFTDSAAVRRQWSWAETDTLETLAGLIGATIARGRYVKDLADANTIVQNSPTILYRLRGEPSLPLIYISHNITKFGHDPAKLVGAPNWLERLVHPEDHAKVRAALARALETGAQAASIECRLLAGDASYRWADNRYTPVRDASGRLVEVEGIIIDITERKAAEEKIALLARTDALTGLANRATFIDRLHQAFAATGRGGTPFAILYLDLDHFKNINDTLGHPVGDLLLREVADRLRRSTRETDLVARLGGDEFAILEADMTEPASAGALAAKLKETLARPYTVGGNELHVTVSIGISPFVQGILGPDAMLAQADLALYRAKDEGRDRFCFHSKELDEQMVTRVALADDLRHALAQSQLELYYQPQIELISGKIVGMEALLRWNHPTRGLLYPKDFIPIAEKTGSIVGLGHWVLDRACRQMRLWQEAGVAPPVVAVNLSLAELKTGRDLISDIEQTLSRHGLAANQLEFDVTEATLAQLTWTQNNVLTALHGLGAKIAIDDFGTQYSSFEYLRAYRVNHVKIAQSFIQGAVPNTDRAATIRAIIVLARELGIEVIAEGVETEEQRRLLVSTGSAEAQGFFFSRPVDAPHAAELLRQGTIRPTGAHP